MLKVTQAAFALACFWGLSDIHGCLGGLQMAKISVDYWVCPLTKCKTSLGPISREQNYSKRAKWFQGGQSAPLPSLRKSPIMHYWFWLCKLDTVLDVIPIWNLLATGQY